MKGARRARGGSRSSGNLGKGRVLKSGGSVYKPPRLKPGQVRCHVCRNATSLTTTGAYRTHPDLFGGPCEAKRPQTFALDELPPVMFRNEPVTPGLDPEKPRERGPVKGKGQGVRLYGECEDCGALVTGERRFCGICLAEHMSRKR